MSKSDCFKFYLRCNLHAFNAVYPPSPYVKMLEGRLIVKSWFLDSPSLNCLDLIPVHPSSRGSFWNIQILQLSNAVLKGLS